MTWGMKSTGNSLDMGRKAALLKQFRQFHKDEGGSLIAFSLFIFIAMLIIGGAAVDIMRAEHQRAKIQYTADRAVLAAASLKQSVPAQDVVDDYFAKEGMGAIAPTAHISGDDGYREVTAYYTEGNSPYINTLFMRWVGINSLPTPSFSVAEDGVSRVEISLVLDVSGSMAWSAYTGDSKINELKKATGQFFDTLLLAPPEPDTYSISIVPFATQVTVGEKLLSKYTVTAEHNYSHCVDFVDADFTSASVSTGSLLQRTGFFSPYSNSSTRPASWDKRVCVPHGQNREILPFGTDINVLKTYVGGLKAKGSTGAEIGVKWGVALLDPSARPAITDLISDGDVDTLADGRPFNYDKKGVMKVLVVMSDGANTKQWMLDPLVASGLSPVWKYTKSGQTRYVIHNPDRAGPNKYLHTNYNSTSGDWELAPDPTATQMTYPELWNHATMGYVDRYMFRPASLPGANWDWRIWGGKFNMIDGEANPVKDNRMKAACSAAKAQGVVIYTIGFEMEDADVAALKDCASSEGHFKKVTPTADLPSVFSQIAAELQVLRLTQ